MIIEVLKLLERDGSLEPANIAEILNMDPSEVEEIINSCEKNKIIMGRAALVDWEKIDDNSVTALIEVSIAPSKGEGFDRIARRIYQYDEVESLSLMSGDYDLSATVRGESLQSVARFVFRSLATIEGVTGTATHFVLKRYKEKNRIYAQPNEQEDRVLFI